MKKHQTRFLWIFAAMLLIGWLASVQFSQRFLSNPLTKGGNGSNDTAGTKSNVLTNQLFSPGEETRKATIRDTANTSNVQNRDEQFQKAVEGRNVRIDFWGEIIDQSGQPVPEVRVKMKVRRGNYSAAAGVGATFDKRETLTDSEGRFELVGAEGDSLSFESISKDGYRLSARTKMGYGFGDMPAAIKADARFPIVIQMWKLGPLTELISFRTLFGFKPDGHPYTLDLLNNKKLEGENADGDLVVKLTRPSNVTPKEKFEWTLELSAIGGGLVEGTNDFMYLAPDTGYQQKVVIHMVPTEMDYASALTKDYFISSREGKVFGAVHLRIRPDYDGESAIFVESWMNPSGSRNLQR